MPNWCMNDAEVTHENPEMMAKFAEAWNAGGLLAAFHPQPDNIGEGWYDWRLANWGTKWDVGLEKDEPQVEVVNNTLQLSFNSAWSPPTGGYEKLAELGFEIRAYYWEPGMCFAGRWSDGEDHCYDITEGTDGLPEDIDRAMGVSENLDLWSQS
jgi:hypothetical protein